MVSKAFGRIFKFVTTNPGLKLLALFISIALWMIVVNVDDPKITRNFTSNVTIDNSTYLTEMGEWYDIPEEETTVTFSVSGKRSYLEKMNGTDFKAVANLENIDDDNRVPIDITAQRYVNYVSVSSKQRYLDVSVEKMVSVPFVISVETTGEVGDGFALGDTTVSPSILRITGPESQVNSISQVVASVQVDGMTTDMSDSVAPVIYDADGNKMSTSDFTLNVSNILVGVSVLRTKEVNVNVNLTSAALDGYSVTAVECSPETILVKGKDSQINKISEININASDVDLGSAISSFTKEYDISDKLPDGISLVNSEDALIQLNITIEKVITSEFEVPADNIDITNLSDKYTAKFTQETVPVSVTGVESLVEKLRANDIKGTVDATDLSIGLHDVSVYWDIDTDIFEVRSNETSIKISLAND